ncbi:multifunctional methyltransferase subunit TRM112-like protein isoform X4 [Bubalus bubalis]|uniref:multifunctional methyltransferase subunit TRM112-like protein isoform X4 n=1 Tax=Bubalus bubalis TaxID=89462 RepID=UPI001D12878A|nr:multifunctional methyltransferase subunit TRM112-like protein isoform X4 [Bubalus bubalis]
MLPGAARDTNRPRLQRAPEVQKVRRFRSSQVSNRIERDSPGNDATEVRINPVEFNPDFIVRMIPKVEWAALLEAADHVRTLLPTSPAQCTPPQGERLGSRDDLSLLPTAASHPGA